MSPDELDRINIVGIRGGLYDMSDPNKPVCVAAPGAIAPAYFDLLRSVAIAHIAIKSNLDTLDRLVQLAEQLGLDEFVSAIDACTASSALARRIACEGVENVQAQVGRNRD